MSEFTTVSVRNGGAFVVSFYVNGTAEGEPWNVESGNFDENDSRTVQVPIDAVDITVDVHGLAAVNDWHTLLKQSWADTSTWPATGLSYHTWGTAPRMHCGPSS